MLDLVEQETGFGLSIRTWDVGSAIPPRAGFFVAFEDDGRYRDVPLLGSEATIRTWQAEDPSGPTLQSWYGTLQGRVVEISVSFPLGRSAQGREVTAPLLQAVCFRGDAAGAERSLQP